ncbi:MAG TPA: hypothetical protein VLZ10_09005 [Thermodesulfobacteriota bacterium]|nr:hypothetical protein [Thermodesulfobacteriota bacterium]
MLKDPTYAGAPAGKPAYANLLRQGYGGQGVSAAGRAHRIQ